MHSPHDAAITGNFKDLSDLWTLADRTARYNVSSRPVKIERR